MTTYMQVIAAYTTDYYPLSGNIPEEVLELATGEGVYCTPGLPDEVYPDMDEAFARCVGTPSPDTELLSDWEAGYPYERLR